MKVVSFSMNFRRFSWLSLVLCLALGLGGCATGGGVSAAQRSQAHRIGVLSAMGDQIHARTESAVIPNAGVILALATSALTTKNHRDTAPEFQMDTAASAVAVQTLRGSNPGALVLSLQAERGSVQPPFNDATLEGTARQLGAKHSLDLVILVVPWSQLIRHNNAVPGEGGYGYGSLSTLGVQGKDMFVYANYAVGVFDGRTGKQVALRNNDGFFKLKGMRWRGPLDRYTIGERQQIGEALRLLIGDEVLKQLREMGLST